MVMVKKGNYFTCRNCSKIIYRSLADQRKTPSKNFRCSKQCYDPSTDKKILARRIVNNAIRIGKIIKPATCQTCNKKVKVQSHHEDYSRPLDIIWVCSLCHDILSYQARLDLIESRRKHFDPCACGNKAVVKNMCKSCYMQLRNSDPNRPSCVVPDCVNISHTRGLCNKHRQNKYIMSLFALPKQKRGTKVKSI